MNSLYYEQQGKGFLRLYDSRNNADVGHDERILVHTSPVACVPAAASAFVNFDGLPCAHDGCLLFLAVWRVLTAGLFHSPTAAVMKVYCSVSLPRA